MALLYAYSFDEASGNILDASGNGRNTTLTGSLARTGSGAGHTDKGMSQSTTAGDSAGPSLTGLQTPNYTVMAWVKRTSNALDGWFAEFKASGSGDRGILFLSGNIQSRARNAAGTVVGATVAQPTAGTWYHAAGTYDGTNLRLFINGSQVASAALSAPLKSTSTGSHLFDALGSETIIDDLRYYDTALDAATITTLMGTPVSGGTTVNLGLAAETDAAQALAATKAVTLGQATETDAAHQVAAAKAATLSAASETDSAHNLSASKQATLTAAAETETAHALAASKQVTLGVASEADSAHALSSASALEVELGTAAEADAAPAIVVAKSVVLGVATETDAVFALLGAKQITLSTATETDTAHELTTGTTPDFALDSATETDSAHPLGAAKAITLAAATETDAALPLVMLKTVILGVAAEADTALALTATKTHSLGTAAETDLAYALVLAGPDPVPGHLVVAHGGPDLVATHSGPALTATNEPSSRLEVSHGV